MIYFLLPFVFKGIRSVAVVENSLYALSAIMDGIIRGSFFADLISDNAGSAISFYEDYNCHVDQCHFLRCKSTGSGVGGCVSMIGVIMKVTTSTFEECEGHVGAAAFEKGSESNFLNLSICLKCSSRFEHIFCQNTGYSTAFLCNVSFCSSINAAPSIQSYRGPRYHYSCLLFCSNDADVGYIPHCLVKEEMETERLCMGNQTVRTALMYYQEGIHLLRGCVFVDETIVGVLFITPADKVTLVNCWFRIPQMEESRIHVQSCSVIGDKEDRTRLLKDRCAFTQKSTAFTKEKDTIPALAVFLVFHPLQISQVP